MNPDTQFPIKNSDLNSDEELKKENLLVQKTTKIPVEIIGCSPWSVKDYTNLGIHTYPVGVCN